ncbi:MAG: toll/interleukin-1 receptor domain-containing protein [Thermoguttaceae bacterium]|nr:toll/interleukin-1 receptor domain-containing protein [Thermoguttaceae bacterium]
MSIEQYQNAVNRFDKEIADLEAKRAEAELKATREEGNAANIRFNKFDSKSLIDSKNRQRKRHMDEAQKARKKAAEFSRSIAEKQKRRNSAYLNLQSEQNNRHTLWQNNSADIWLRALDTHVLHQNKSVCESAEYDVFVSYAHEDKAFVNELVAAFQKRGIRVWIDSLEIGWGDSIRTKIDEGLNKSRYGIVILTSDYIDENKYWTRTELEGLLQVESIKGKIILPIWHNLTKEQVIKYSPTIAQRNAISTAIFTTDEIAEKLEQLLNADKNKEPYNG